MDKPITNERSFTLDFTEEDFPGWETGAMLPNPYNHRDGDQYLFSGSAVVEEIQHQVGAVVSVKVTHYPAIP